MADTIIIIRGNSGSGKTTVANKLCDKLGEDCMLLSQDVIRRGIFKSPERKDGRKRAPPLICSKNWFYSGKSIAA